MCRAVAEAMVTGHPPRRPGRDRDRQVAGVPRPGCAERQEGRHRHGDQGAAGPAGREGPAPGGCGTRAAGAAGLRRAQGAEQLRLPPAGGRGGLGWDSGRARRPGAGTGRRAGAGGSGWKRPRSRCVAAPAVPPEGIVEEVRQLVAWSQKSTERRPGRPELRALRPGLEHGERRPAGVPRAPTTAPPAGAASPRRPASGPRWPTSWWSTPTSTGRTWPAAAWCCPSTTW